MSRIRWISLGYFRVLLVGAALNYIPGLTDEVGNDDIMLTVLADQEAGFEAFYHFERQGYGDYRYLVVLKVVELADMLRHLGTRGARRKPDERARPGQGRTNREKATAMPLTAR